MSLPSLGRCAACLAVPAVTLILAPATIALGDAPPGSSSPAATDPAADAGSPDGPGAPGDLGSPDDGQPGDGSNEPAPPAPPSQANPLAPTLPGDSGAPAPTAPLVLPPGIGMRAGHAYLTRSAPGQVRAALAAGNRLQDKPYRWGGGHARFQDSGYDCSGSVSYLLHAAHLLSSPLDSRGLAHWGEAGAGRWITVYASRSHAFVLVAGLRLDTSGNGPSGPRWRIEPRSLDRFKVRHPPGL